MKRTQKRWLSLLLLTIAVTLIGSGVTIVAHALTPEQCAFFSVGGKVQICHATESPTTPYVLLNVPESACEALSAHPNDHVAFQDPTCEGNGSLPEGSPCDPTVPCAEGLACIGGSCRPPQ